MAVEETLSKVLNEFKSIASADTIIGKPIDLGNDKTIIPISKVSIGFAGGGGDSSKDKQSGSGSGGGASIEPVAFIVVIGDKVTIEKIKGADLGLGDLIEKIPGLIGKVWKKKSDDDKKEDKDS